MCICSNISIEKRSILPKVELVSNFQSYNNSCPLVRGPQDPVPVADAELPQVDARGRHLQHGLRQHGAIPLSQPRGGLPGIQTGTYIRGHR